MEKKINKCENILNNKMRVLLVSIVLLLSISFVSADVPRSISLEGRLADSTNTVLEGSYDFNFTLFDALVGGNKLYEKETTLTTDSRRVYAINLPNVNIQFYTNYYLQIEVEGDVFTPRLEIATNPYSFISNVSLGLDCVGCVNESMLSDGITISDLDNDVGFTTSEEQNATYPTHSEMIENISELSGSLENNFSNLNNSLSLYVKHNETYSGLLINGTNNDTYESYITWGKYWYNMSDGAGGNLSWNESGARDIFNISWSEQLARTIFNITWTEAVAKTLFTSFTWVDNNIVKNRTESETTMNENLAKNRTIIEEQIQSNNTALNNSGVWEDEKICVVDIDTNKINCNYTDQTEGLSSEQINVTYPTHTEMSANDSSFNKTGTWTDGKWCVYDSGSDVINCNVEPVSDTNTNCSEDGSCDFITYDSELTYTIDTNESDRFENLTLANCPENYVQIGVATNGTVECKLEASNGSWTEAVADTLYADIIYDYNQSYGSESIWGKWWNNQTTGAIDILTSVYGKWWNNQTTGAINIIESKYDFNQLYNHTLELLTIFPNLDTDSTDDADLTSTMGNDTYEKLGNVSMYNLTYEGSVNNGSYLSTYNATYDVGINATFNESLTREIFYDSEADLTTLLDDNYADITLGNESGDLYTYIDTADSAQDECSEVTNCVPNAYDSYDDIPSASPSDADTTHFSTAGAIYTWAVGLFLQSETDPVFIAQADEYVNKSADETITGHKTFGNTTHNNITLKDGSYELSIYQSGGEWVFE